MPSTFDCVIGVSKRRLGYDGELVWGSVKARVSRGLPAAAGQRGEVLLDGVAGLEVGNGHDGRLRSGHVFRLGLVRYRNTGGERRERHLGLLRQLALDCELMAG